jgi:hypothetical protein
LSSLSLISGKAAPINAAASWLSMPFLILKYLVAGTKISV